MITVFFQKYDWADRAAGLLTTWHHGEVYQPSHYCLVVEEGLFADLKYKKVSSGIDSETGEEVFSNIDKGITYLLDIDKLKELHPECETELIYTNDISLVKGVHRG